MTPIHVPTVDRLEASMADGRPMLNNYVRHALIGRGKHGEVYLCYRLDPRSPDDKRVAVAMKSVRREDTVANKYKSLRRHRAVVSGAKAVIDDLHSSEWRIRKEIAIMKKLNHPNLTRLYEVIDDRMRSKIYMVMEYLSGGEVKWRTEDGQPALTLKQTCRIFRDLIVAIEHMHHHGVIHRDIKPSNILWTGSRRRVKLGDFGVSVVYHTRDEDDETINHDSDLHKRAGTPAFLAPELLLEFCTEELRNLILAPYPKGTVRPPITPNSDIWALGATLFCLLFGVTPYSTEATEFALYNSIAKEDWSVPPNMCREQFPTNGRNPNKKKHPEAYMVMSLLEGMLEKNPAKRMSIEEIKCHPWVTQDLVNPEEWIKLTSPTQPKVKVTQKEMSSAMTTLRFRWGHWGLSGIQRGVSAFFRPLKPRSQTISEVNYNPDMRIPPQDISVYTAQTNNDQPGSSKIPRDDNANNTPTSSSSNTTTNANNNAHNDDNNNTPSRPRRFLDIISWKPTKYPSASTSSPLQPLLTDVHAPGMMSFNQQEQSHLSLADRRNRGPLRAISTLEGGLRQPLEDFIGVGQPQDTLSPTSAFGPGHNNNNGSSAFKRASSWGQGDVAPSSNDTDGYYDYDDDERLYPGLDQNVQMVGAGGVETPTGYNAASPTTPSASAGIDSSKSTASGYGFGFGGGYGAPGPVMANSASGSGSASGGGTPGQQPQTPQPTQQREHWLPRTSSRLKQALTAAISPSASTSKSSRQSNSKQKAPERAPPPLAATATTSRTYARPNATSLQPYAGSSQAPRSYYDDNYVPYNNYSTFGIEEDEDWADEDIYGYPGGYYGDFNGDANRGSANIDPEKFGAVDNDGQEDKETKMRTHGPACWDATSTLSYTSSIGGSGSGGSGDRGVVRDRVVVGSGFDESGIYDDDDDGFYGELIQYQRADSVIRFARGGSGSGSESSEDDDDEGLVFKGKGTSASATPSGKGKQPESHSQSHSRSRSQQQQRHPHRPSISRIIVSGGNGLPGLLMSTTGTGNSTTDSETESQRERDRSIAAHWKRQQEIERSKADERQRELLLSRDRERLERQRREEESDEEKENEDGNGIGHGDDGDSVGDLFDIGYRSSKRNVVVPGGTAMSYVQREDIGANIDRWRNEGYKVLDPPPPFAVEKSRQQELYEAMMEEQIRNKQVRERKEREEQERGEGEALEEVERSRVANEDEEDEDEDEDDEDEDEEEEDRNDDSEDEDEEEEDDDDEDEQIAQITIRSRGTRY